MGCCRPIEDVNDLKVGDKIHLSYPENGYEPDKIRANDHRGGIIFTIKEVHVHNWNTDILVEENNLVWNSVQFDLWVDK